jgi:hypothetical protein
MFVSRKSCFPHRHASRTTNKKEQSSTSFRLCLLDTTDQNSQTKEHVCPIQNYHNGPCPVIHTRKTTRTRGTLNSSSKRSGHQDSLLYTQFSRIHPSSISSSIHCGAYLSLYLNISMWDLVLKNLSKRILWYNRNLIWIFGLWVIIFFSNLNMWGPPLQLSPLSSLCASRML